jgi:hypothetical protein
MLSLMAVSLDERFSRAMMKSAETEVHQSRTLVEDFRGGMRRRRRCGMSLNIWKY